MRTRWRWRRNKIQAKFEDLQGRTLQKIDVHRDGRNDEIVFVLAGGEAYKLYHDQDCCESVTIEDICGDFAGLIGVPILLAQCVSSNENPAGVPAPEWQDDSFTWTFYKLATTFGYVTIRWYGESNGYYSEAVDFVKVA